jgi:hypothetical protein
MPDSEQLSEGKGVSRGGCALAAGVMAGVMILLSRCVEPPPPRPPRPAAPRIDSLDVVGEKIRGRYREAVRISFSAPDSAPAGIDFYEIIRKSEGDSAFDSIVTEIPRDVHEYFDVIDGGMGFPSLLQYRAVFYRMYAVDSLGRSGDTSATARITLVWQPKLMYPSPSDTLTRPELQWGVELIGGPYYTYPFLWSADRGLLWRGEQSPTPVYGGEGLKDTVMPLPASVLPLEEGMYYYGAKVIVENSELDWPQSLAIGEFYVTRQ